MNARFGIQVDHDNGHHVHFRVFSATGGQHLGVAGTLVMTADEYAAFRELLGPRLTDRPDPAGYAEPVAHSDGTGVTFDPGDPGSRPNATALKWATQGADSINVVMRDDEQTARSKAASAAAETGRKFLVLAGPGLPDMTPVSVVHPDGGVEHLTTAPNPPEVPSA